MMNGFIYGYKREYSCATPITRHHLQYTIFSKGTAVNDFRLHRVKKDSIKALSVTLPGRFMLCMMFNWASLAGKSMSGVFDAAIRVEDQSGERVSVAIVWPNTVRLDSFFIYFPWRHR